MRTDLIDRCANIQKNGEGIRLIVEAAFSFFYHDSNFKLIGNMKKTIENSKICKSCYQRLDCDILPGREDWCVYYKKDQEIKLQEEISQDMTDTVEMSDDKIKSIIDKLK